MNRKNSYPLAAIATVILAVAGAVTVDGSARAEPGEIGSGGLHMVASANSNNVVPSPETALGVPFAHSVKVSGDFSVALDGESQLRGGEIVAGYLIGCAIDLSNGISIGIAPSVGASAAIAPSVGVDFGVDLGLAIDAPPTVGIGAGVGFAIQPSVGVESGLAAELAVGLAPGTVTAAVIGAAELDEESTFPYTFAHSNTPLNVSGCLSPASAMPFVTVRADSRGGSVQTTGYGAPFGF
ncbi:MspA family porin [Nocardia sp. NBC_01329]|uniref:MspA family porin n=1 Tax=Nocardia sp. NBC_01329 TaxID=2903594 RepID=UPI002E129F94|nr:MspA family porin [Nocardia sp. NBC_01329]